MPYVTAPQPPHTRELIRSFFPPERRAYPSVQSLVTRLMAFIEATDLSARLDAFVKLKEWTASTAPSPLRNGTNRLETALTLLESQSELRVRFQSCVREILTEIRSVELFAEAGLHPRQGLWSEAVRRLLEELLPSALDDTDLSKFVFRLYPTR